MKNACLLAAGMMVISSVCFAAPPQAGDKQKGQENSRREQMRKRFQQGQGQGQGQGDRAQRPGMQGDPAQMVSMMISRFDEDGDKKLDAKELTAMFTKMRGMMGRRGGPGIAGEQGGPGAKGQGAKGRGRNRGAGEGGDAGGQRPKRPGRPDKAENA